jgi:hypothetical protein
MCFELGVLDQFFQTLLEAELGKNERVQKNRTEGSPPIRLMMD